MLEFALPYCFEPFKLLALLWGKGCQSSTPCLDRTTRSSAPSQEVTGLIPQPLATQLPEQACLFSESGYQTPRLPEPLRFDPGHGGGALAPWSAAWEGSEQTCPWVFERDQPAGMDRQCFFKPLGFSFHR